MPDQQIFKATYSGVPVYEMMIKTIAVMRRRVDGWLNATQILKVAGFDKPQRTRVLEREVQKGEHEKVQGGYGKYQGTWVPADRGLALARQYNCEALIKPIIDFLPSGGSPPPAPKHMNASPSKAAQRKEAALASASMATRSSNRRVYRASTRSPSAASLDDSLTASPSQSSASSRTPSPINEMHPVHALQPAVVRETPEPPSTGKKKTNEADGYEGRRDPKTYSNQILEYFISDSNQIPKFLMAPPMDYDPNLAIDDDGHTALHWASAMGRLKIVKHLLTAGADVFKVNKTGQTALMRSVMFANNYDVRKFLELYELLHRSTLNIDNNNRTVFHHIVDVAMSKGKTHAARYYMETILNRLSDYPTELEDIINFKDEDDETALTLAARCRSKRLVKLLIDHGADPKIVNKDGKSAEDYILEDERFRFSPPLPNRLNALPARSSQNSHATIPLLSHLQSSPKMTLHHSNIAQRASTKVATEISGMLENLAASFDCELLEKERDLNQAHALLANIEAEIVESQRAVMTLKSQAAAVDQAKASLEKLESGLILQMRKRHRLGWEKWSKDEEIRERQQLENPKKVTGDGTSATNDVVDLHVAIPSDAAGLKASCEALRAEIGAHKKQRIGFDSFVKHQAEAGTGGKMNEYRRLIAAGCGNITPLELEPVISTLLETMETEEVTSATPWGRTASLPSAAAVSAAA